jgi:hypothetical protein
VSHFATFSADAPRAAIYVTDAQNQVVASAHPSFGDNPLAALRVMGYVLADSYQRNSFKPTVKVTGYQRVAVVPIRKAIAAKKLPDHDERLKAAHARAEWELSDATWADKIIAAYLDPDTDTAQLAEEMDA